MIRDVTFYCCDTIDKAAVAKLWVAYKCDMNFIKFALKLVHTRTVGSKASGAWEFIVAHSLTVVFLKK